MSGKRIIVRINFNNYTMTQECLTKEWIDYRISIFMNYTLKSLQAQTNQAFKAYVLFNPGTEDYIKQALAGFDPLPENVKFIIEADLNKKIIEYIDGYEELFFVHLESDDMYRNDFMQRMHDYTLQDTNNVAVICPYGYMYDSVQNRLVKFYFYAPSFCVFVYKVIDFQKGLRYNLSKGWTSTLNYPYEVFKDPCYINHCHGKNSGISFERASFWRPRKESDVLAVWDDHAAPTKAVFGPEITDKQEIERILAEFTGRG